MPHGRHAYAYASHGPSRSQLRSHMMTLLALLLVFVYTNWLYQGLRHSAHQQRSNAGALQVDLSDGSAVQLDESDKEQPDGQQGQLVGSQLTRSVTGGFLFAWGLDNSFRLGQVGGSPETPQLALSHLEVVSAAASRHSLVVGRDGGVVSMGPNDSRGGGGHGSRPLPSSGQLGRAGGSAPGPVTGLEGVRVVQVAAGRFHSLAVTGDGQLLSWGSNDYGQLGRQVPAAAAADATPQRHLAAAAAAAGGTAVTASDGALESHEEQHSSAMPLRHMRSSSDGVDTCGSGCSCHSAVAGRVSGLDDVVVVAAAAGRYSSLALDDQGQLWVVGFDGCATAGQLPERGDMWRARRVEGQLAGHRVVAFDAGYTFWLAATSDGRLFSCDTGDDGYAGTLPQKDQQPRHAHLGRTGPPHEPGLVKSLAEQVVVAVAAGRQHALVATAAGGVFSWGPGSRAIRGRDGPDEVALPVESLSGQHVLFVAAGEYYSLAATRSRVFGWGSNSYLCTGTGRPADEEVAEPTPVTGPLDSGDWVIQGLAGGYQHAFAIADKPGDKELQELREAAVKAAAAAAAAGAGVGGVAGVEVVLTDQQRQEQVKYLQQQQQQQKDAEEGGQQGQERAAPASTAALPVQDEQQDQKPAADEPQADGSSPAPSALPAAPSPLQDSPAPSSAPSMMPTQQPANSPRANWHVAYLQQHSAEQRQQLSVQEVWLKFQPRPWHNDLVRLSGDVFELLPKQFNAQQRNPCWGSGPELACLPFFNIIGVSKCGTTDLYSRLTKHKEAILPATNKGPHFWDESVFPKHPPADAPSGSAAKDFKAYVRLFSRAADLIRSRPGAVTGEASSNTFTSANGVYLRGFRGDQPVEAWAGPHGANVSLPALLREAQPYLRLIVMLRNPVDRYHSAFHYYRWWKNETAPPTPEDFHAHAQAELKQWDECVGRQGVPACMRRYQPQQLVKGMYQPFLQDWLRHWPRQQLLVLRLEDYKAALSEHLSAVLDFLSVPVPTDEDAASWTSMLEAPVENKKQYPPMRDDTRKLLQAFYQPFNKALAKALNDERWAWEDEPATSPA